MKEIGVAGATPTVGMRRLKPPSGPWGWSGHPERPNNNNNNNNNKREINNRFGFFGVVLGAWGWFRPLYTSRRGWPKPPPGPWGWSTPKSPNFFFFSFCLSG
jgi:hypothetical protein